MDYHVSRSGDHCSIICCTRIESTGSRDLARIELASDLQIHAGAIYIDLGIPVYHSRSVEVHHRIQPDDLKDHDQIALLGKLITGSILSKSTRRPMVPAGTRQNESGEFDEFTQLFPELVEAGKNYGFDAAGPTEQVIEIDDDIVEFGFSAGILTEDNDKLIPVTDMLEINILDDRCALVTNEEIGRMSTLPGIGPSPDLDLNAAGMALKSVNCPKPSTVWYYGNTSNPAHEFRIQAANSYPVLAEIMIDRQSISDAIDNCQPLRPKISEHTGLTPSKLKRLSGIDLSRWIRGDLKIAAEDGLDFQFGNGSIDDWNIELGRLLAICQKTDAGWCPDHPQEWMALQNLHAGFIMPLVLRYEQDPVILLQPARGRWQAYVDKLASLVDLESAHFDRRAMQLVTEEICGVVEDFVCSILLPQILFPYLQSATALPYPTSEVLRLANNVAFELLSEPGIDRIGSMIRVSQRWQNRLQSLYTLEQQSMEFRIARETKKIRTSKTWPRLTDDFTTSDGYVIRCLNSTDALREESRRLNHCVGSLYLASARQGQVHLYSIQDESGNISHSTFEVSRPNSKQAVSATREIRLVQHKTRANGKPGKNLRIALDEWYSAINSGKLAINLEEVLDWRSRAKMIKLAPSEAHRSVISPKMAWDRILSLSWNDHTITGQIWTEWNSHVFQGKLRRLVSASDLLADKRVMKLSHALSE